jgi:hypothetical protein
MIPFDRTAHGWRLFFRPIPSVGGRHHGRDLPDLYAAIGVRSGLASSVLSLIRAFFIEDARRKSR